MSGEARELRRLATLDRNRGAEQIRWSFDIFEPEDDGQPARYITARKWYKADGAEWRPTKAGVTIRMGELDEVIEALQRVQRARDQQTEPQPRRPTHTDRQVSRSELTPDELDEVF